MRYNDAMTLAKDPLLKQKIDATFQILKNGEKSFFNNDAKEGCLPNWYSFYATTNENLGYFQKFASFEDKDVLTVTASGDHALNAVYFGAKSVETFDINELTFFAYDLKQAALLNLSRQDFLDFYSDIPLFNKKIYDKFSSHLSLNTKTFFDAVFNFLEDAGINKHVMLRNLVEGYPVECDPGIFVRNNPYLASEKTFKETKKLIGMLKEPVRHKFCPAHRLGENFSQKDIVILSNILHYYFCSFYSNADYQVMKKNAEMSNNFLKSLSKVLKPDGQVSLFYEFGGFLPLQMSDRCKSRLGVDTEKFNISRVNRKSQDVVYAATAKDIKEATK